MRLILPKATRQAHSALRHSAWRRVVADYVAERLDPPEQAAPPRLVAHISLAIAVSSYEEWLADPIRRPPEILRDNMNVVRAYCAMSRQ